MGAADLVNIHGGPLRASASAGRHHSREGARHSGSLANWQPREVSPQQAEREKAEIQNRAWDLYTNTPIGRGIISGAKVDTIGTGLTPLPKIDAAKLSISAEAALEMKQALVDNFLKWGFDPRHFCDAQGRQSFYQLQGWAYVSWKIDGIAVLQVNIEEPDDIRPLRLSLTPIDAARLGNPRLSTMSGKDIYDGVEVDEKGKPVAVWIRDKSASGTSRLRSKTGTSTSFPIISPVTGLPEFLLVTGVDNIAEYKQGSTLEPIIKLIRDAEDYHESALIGAIQQHLFSVFMEQTQAQSGFGGDPLAGNEGMSKQDWEKAVFEIDKGMIVTGPKGYAPKPLEANKPGPDYEAHFNSIEKHVGTATQKGVENLTRQYNSSFSASMANILNAERFSAEERGVMDSKFNQPIWSWLCWEQAASGMITLPRGVDPVRDLFDYSEAAFLPPPMKVLQPLQAAKANEVKLKTGETSLSRIFAENNIDPAEGFRQMAIDERRKLDMSNEYGVDLGAKPWPPPENEGATNG